MKKTETGAFLDSVLTHKINKMNDIMKHTKVPKKFSDFPMDTSNKKWGLSKPSTIRQRRKLMAECGPSCFLDPSELKFPVCNKISNTISHTHPKCMYNKRAITRAVPSRAGEWKYVDVTKADQKLEKKLGLLKNKT